MYSALLHGLSLARKNSGDSTINPRANETTERRQSTDHGAKNNLEEPGMQNAMSSKYYLIRMIPTLDTEI